MYNWRKLNATEREQVLRSRKSERRPWHSPAHRKGEYSNYYLLSAACYDHKPVIGATPERMAASEEQLLAMAVENSQQVFAWCVLPNHYHLLLQTDDIAHLLYEIGRMHGRLSHLWNGEDSQRGRKVWFNCVERAMKSERHFWTTLNYVHHNPVRHGYVSSWEDWPYSSAADYLKGVGREKAIEIWNEYPILDYGEKWDVA